MKELFEAKGFLQNGATVMLYFSVQDYGNVLKITVPTRDFDGIKCETVELSTELLKANIGDEGYFFYPTDFRSGFVMTEFKERANCEFFTWISVAPVCGLCACKRAVFVRVEGLRADARFAVRVKDGVYSITPRFELEGDAPDEDITVYIYKMPYALYPDMAKLYRKYQIEVNGCQTLRERAELREPLRKAAEAVEIRVRMGWKPIPTAVRVQTEQNEPPLHVTCTVQALNKILDRMQEVGIKKAEICLVGWGMSGHDGRFPQQYPSDPRYGGDREMRKFIARAHRLGYQVVCHTVSCGAYVLADNYDVRDMAKRLNEKGEPYVFVRDHYKMGGLNGGDPYAVCPQRAYERYAKEDLPVVRGYGFSGLHYVDELTAYVPEKCHDPNHPVSRTKAQYYYKKIAQLSKNLFGGYQSEGIMDFIMPEIDAVLYTSVMTKDVSSENSLFDEGIPFWQLVYHGIVLSNATGGTVNYTVKEGKETLTFVEYGGRPVFYFNSKFGPSHNWMGDFDLYSTTDEEIQAGVDAIKLGYDEYEELMYLQYEFMENHEKLSENVYRTTFSDTTTITVDYEKLFYTVRKPNGTVLKRTLSAHPQSPQDRKIDFETVIE